MAKGVTGSNLFATLSVQLLVSTQASKVTYQQLIWGHTCLLPCNQKIRYVGTMRVDIKPITYSFSFLLISHPQELYLKLVRLKSVEAVLFSHSNNNVC